MTGDLALDHVQIAMPVGGEDQARAFFAGLLGLTEIAKPADMAAPGGCWFGLGAHQLHIGSDAAFAPAKKAHVALTTDSLELLRERLTAAGYRVVDDTPIGGRARYFSDDPFGNRIEFIAAGARM